MATLRLALLGTGAEDRAAFAELYRLTSAKLFGICLRICGDRQAAEDVLQEVYIQVWRRAASYEPARAGPITWLATIARNKAIDWRRARHLPPPPASAQDWDEVADDHPLSDAVLLDAEEERRLHLCLEAIEARTAGAIRTAFFDGLTYAELAARDGVPLGTMKSVIRRGLLRLRECLTDDA